MKAISKLGLLLAVALLASAAVAASAQAISITPPGAIAGTTADNADPTLNYDTATVICQNSDADGTADGTDSITDLTVTFDTDCTVLGIDSTVDCTGTATLTATVAEGTGSGSGTVDLNPDFLCVITVPGLCNITVAGEQDPSAVNRFDNTDNTLDALTNPVTVTATNDGSALCGPPSGPASFTAVYQNITPDALSITNP